MNILTNAIDALVEHHDTEDSFIPCINISTAQLNNNQVVITIVDNGPGIATDIKPKIFDPFFTTKAVGQGTGMGLAISYHIITEQHQGQLLVDSTPAETRFEIRLPITRSLPTTF